jgi:hypothetical protein
MYLFSHTDSATVIYQDAESAYLCKKHLGDQYYKGRVLTITIEVKKSYPNSSTLNNLAISQDEEIARQIATMKPEQRKMLLGLLKKFKGPGEIL